jgi:hypothetical protein
MALPGDRVTDNTSGRTGVVATRGAHDGIVVGRTLVSWDDDPEENDEVEDFILSYETFVLVRQDDANALYATADGNQTADLAKAAKFDGREMAQRFKNEKNQFSWHELRLLRECQ